MAEWEGQPGVSCRPALSTRRSTDLEGDRIPEQRKDVEEDDALLGKVCVWAVRQAECQLDAHSCRSGSLTSPARRRWLGKVKVAKKVGERCKVQGERRASVETDRGGRRADSGGTQCPTSSSECYECGGLTRVALSHLSASRPAVLSRECRSRNLKGQFEWRCKKRTVYYGYICSRDLSLYCSACPGGGAGVTGTWCFPASRAIRIGDAASGYSLRSRRSKVESVRFSTGSSNRKGRNGIVPRLLFVVFCRGGERGCQPQVPHWGFPSLGRLKGKLFQ